MSLRSVLRVAIIVVVVVVLVYALLWACQRRLIYHPDTAPPAADTKPPSAEDVVLRTEDGLELGAWLTAPTGPDRDAAILVAGGNGGNRGSRGPLAIDLAAEGFTVLLFDYRGYGGNDGSPSEGGLYADARAAYRFLTESAGFEPQRILFYGESLGTGVVSHLTTEHRPAGLVLRSPFTDLAAVPSGLYVLVPVRLLLRDDFPVTEHIEQAPVPTVVAYGTADGTVEPRLSAEVADVAAEAGADVTEVVVDGADHNDPELVHGPQIIAAVVKLADQVGLTAPR